MSRPLFAACHAEGRFDEHDLHIAAAVAERQTPSFRSRLVSLTVTSIGYAGEHRIQRIPLRKQPRGHRDQLQADVRDLSRVVHTSPCIGTEQSSTRVQASWFAALTLSDRCLLSQQSQQRQQETVAPPKPHVAA